MNTLGLYRLRMTRNGNSWVVGLQAEMELLVARNKGGDYLVTPSCSLREEPNLLGLPLRVDCSLPENRIELRDHRDRVLGAVDNVGP